jgi:hypothetical protein
MLLNSDVEDLNLLQASTRDCSPCSYWFSLGSFTSLDLNRVFHTTQAVSAFYWLPGLFFHPEYGGNTFFRNVGELLQGYNASY